MRNRNGTKSSEGTTQQCYETSLLPARLRRSYIGLRPRGPVPKTFLVAVVLVASFLLTNPQFESQDYASVGLIVMDNPSPTPTRRFPRYGTPEFPHKCSWTTASSTSDHRGKCTILSRPSPRENEGIADWASKDVSGFMLANLHGCNFFMDYGLNVDINQVLVPHQDGIHNWTTPTGFECVKERNCATARYTSQLKRQKEGAYHEIIVPNYRNAFKPQSPVLHIFRRNFGHLQAALPGFELETGMACAMESLMKLSPKAAQFEPELFTRILPTLRDERNLVMTVYIRSGRTDTVASAERNGDSLETVAEDQATLRNLARRSTKCVQRMEKKLLASSEFSSSAGVAWLVVSDSPYLKQLITEEFTSPNINATGVIDDSKHDIPRQIITTTAAGVHSRGARNPSTADFADGMIDWYLIGESDVVFTNSHKFTFGTTAALRTNRPVFTTMACTEMVLIHEEEPPFMEEIVYTPKKKKKSSLLTG